jgi:flagellar FliJ protein
MAFRFPLQTLLRLREIAEQREERLLGQILNQVAQSRQILAELSTQRTSLLLMREQAIQQRTSSAEINGYYDRLRTIDELERAGSEQLDKLVSLCDQQAKVYEAAHRQTELLAGMRDDQKEIYLRELDRQEQKMMDDNFSSRRSFR